MITMAVLACLAGILVGVSRQVNGRLSLTTGALGASVWNHIVGFAALTVVGLVIGGLWPAGALTAPWYVYLGGPAGVVFVALASWVVTRIGAVKTSALMIAGQMITGVAADLLSGASGSLVANGLGVALIIAGLLVVQKRS